MGRKILSLAMVTVLAFLVAGCGNNDSKKLVPVWVWDNYAMDLSGFLINDDESVFVKEENRGVLQEVIAYYNPRKEFVHTTKYDEACVVNRRLITLDYSNNQSSIYDLSSEASCLQIEGELCQEQIDKKSLLFENSISDGSKGSYINLGKNLIKTNLNGIVLWSLDFKDNNSGYFYPVNLDDNEKMTLFVDKDNQLFFVTHEGMMKYSLSDGSILAKCRFDRAKLGSTKIQQDKAETLGYMLYPNQKRGILSEKLLGKKVTPIQPSSNGNDELLPDVKDGYVFVQASKKLVIYDLYTFDELYLSDILFDSCDVVNGYVYLKNQDGIAKLEFQQ